MKKIFQIILIGMALLSSRGASAADNSRVATSSAAFVSAIVTPLKGLKPETRDLSRLPDQAFRWQATLHRKFSYSFSLDVAVDSETGQLEDLRAELSQLKKFIASAESDTRGRLILENNSSGLPALLILTGRGPDARYQIHHPMHDIIFTPVDKRWSYAYSGALPKFGALPEIRRAQSDPSVRDFVAGLAAPVRVAATGSPQTFFDCSFFAEGGKVLKVRVDQKSVKTLSK
jgi:hypothetical protein